MPRNNIPMERPLIQMPYDISERVFQGYFLISPGPVNEIKKNPQH